MVKRRYHRIEQSKSLLRSIETFGEHLKVGLAVIRRARSSPLKNAVDDIAKEIGKSRSYVWRALKVGRAVDKIKFASSEETVHKLNPREIAEIQHSVSKLYRSRRRAEVFLEEQLWRGPQAAERIKILARKAGIADRTLRRAAEKFVAKRRHGGPNGYWVWQLSAWAKNLPSVKTREWVKKIAPWVLKDGQF
jgi:hypothetical protein